jgi:hypothetical protein
LGASAPFPVCRVNRIGDRRGGRSESTVEQTVGSQP